MSKEKYHLYVEYFLKNISINSLTEKNYLFSLKFFMEAIKGVTMEGYNLHCSIFSYYNQ